MNRLKLVIFILFLSVTLWSQTRSPFNHLELKDTTVYSFIVSGHWHGASTNTSTYPAATVLASLDSFNSLSPGFILLAGDLYLDINERYISNYERSLFRKLRSPIFNAVGNHDLSNNNLYTKVYGNTWFSFRLGRQLYIFLDTEKNDGSIQGEQMSFLKTCLGKINAEISQVFVISHRPVWAENNSRYAGLFEGNTRRAIGKVNFDEEVKPLLESLDKPVYWISGSLASGSASLFYDKDPQSNITFIQSAIRDLPRDAVLQVSVDGDSLHFAAISLTGQPVSKVEGYDLEFWKGKSGAQEDKFNWRLVPYLTMQMLLHWYFWCGLLIGILFLLVIRAMYKRWKAGR
jgi:hypothetical protein